MCTTIECSFVIVSVCVCVSYVCVCRTCVHMCLIVSVSSDYANFAIDDMYNTHFMYCTIHISTPCAIGVAINIVRFYVCKKQSGSVCHAVYSLISL